MSVTITSSLPVALVSGAGVTFDAPVVNSISTDDVYSPNNPNETLTELLSAISSAKLVGFATIDGTAIGNTPVFTVPSGNKFIPTSIVFALTNVSASGNNPIINVGFAPPNYTNYIDSTLSTLYTVAGGSIFNAGSGYNINDTLGFLGGLPTMSIGGVAAGSIGGIFTGTADGSLPEVDNLPLLHISATTHGTINVGDFVSGTDGTNSLPVGCYIVDKASANTYLISAFPAPSSMGSTTITVTSNILDITSFTSGTIAVGDIIMGTGISVNTYITRQINGTPGRIGLYQFAGDAQIANSGINETITIDNTDNFATITVTSTSIVALDVNAPGTIYAPGDQITLAGGVPVTRGIVTVLTVKLVSATIDTGGSGYDGGIASTFDVTVGDGSHSVVATVNVTTNGAGVVNTINSVSTAGSYTSLPTLLGNVVTGDNGTNHGVGLTLNLVFGVNTITITDGGNYTTEASSFTQFSTTSAHGTGATFGTALFGVVGYSLGQKGTYINRPSNHIALTGGTGDGATFDAVWEAKTGLFMTIDKIGQLITFDNFLITGSVGGYVYMTGGQQLNIRVVFPATYSTYIMKAFVFGFTFS